MSTCCVFREWSEGISHNIVFSENLLVKEAFFRGESEGEIKKKKEFSKKLLAKGLFFREDYEGALSPPREP